MLLKFIEKKITKKFFKNYFFFILFVAFIEKNTWSGLEDFYSNLVRAIHAEMLHKGSSMQGRRKSKKRKTGKSMQHQTSTVTSNDNEDDDDDDEEVGDIRTNSNGEKKNLRVFENRRKCLI